MEVMACYVVVSIWSNNQNVVNLKAIAIPIYTANEKGFHRVGIKKK